MAKDLQAYGQSCVGEAIYGMDKLDMERLRSEVDERVHTDAESACIYYSDCLDIISDYEREFGGDAADYGKTYKPSEWQEAAAAYAYGVAVNAVRHYADEALDAVDDAADTLIGALDGAASVEDLRVSLQCPHGWAAHDREDADGVLYWEHGQVDGLHAVAIDAGAFWLSYTWNPADVEG